MRSLLMPLRRIEWLILFSYTVIMVVEIVVLRNLSGSPEANLIRYITFFSVILLSLLLVRQQIVKPIQEMRKASLRMSEGNYQQKLPPYSNVELNELAQAFNYMMQTIEMSEQRRVALIGDVAHELRTPLNNIKITMEGVIDQVIAADQITFFAVQHEVSRLQRLVSQLELLSRAESEQIVLHKQKVDLPTLINDVVKRLAIQFEDKGVALETAVTPHLPPICADPDRITQILINLLGNALQYTPPKGTVTLTVQQENSQIVVSVADTGVGLAEADLTRIFERFYRVDKSRARESGGNGIGLTIVMHLVAAHNGRIWASSAGLNKGTTLTFTLPLQSAN